MLFIPVCDQKLAVLVKHLSILDLKQPPRIELVGLIQIPVFTNTSQR